MELLANIFRVILGIFTGRHNPKITAPQYLSMLDAMRALEGIDEDRDTDVILSWRPEMVAAHPELGPRWKEYIFEMKDPRSSKNGQAWCGFGAGICAIRCGFMPPYDPENEVKSFMWAQAWKLFGQDIPKEDAQPGDVCVLARHVTVLARRSGDTFICLGCNQGDRCKETSYNISEIQYVRRHP